MTSKGKSAGTGDLFLEGSGQLKLVDKSVEQVTLEKGKVECLGMRFESESARRAYFTERLREKLADPDFRKTPGFPKGSDDDIVRMSDPPWYTACPNPFLSNFVHSYGKPYDPDVRYERDPFAVDTSVGKTDALYKAHGYHTKVPHLAIVPSILHYTQPGDIVLDGFAGSGMTGVAAQWCGSAPAIYKMQIDTEFAKRGAQKPKWGARRAILNDLGPAATVISANYSLPSNVELFQKVATQILNQVEHDYAWMFEVQHGASKGRLNYLVWSEIFSCPSCGRTQAFFDAAFDMSTHAIREDIRCLHCDAELNSRTLGPVFETAYDNAAGRTYEKTKRVPVLINYSVGKTTYERAIADDDRELLEKIESQKIPGYAPDIELPDVQMTRVGRMKTTKTSRISDFFFHRTLIVLSALWERCMAQSDVRLRIELAAWIDSQLRNLSILNRYRPHVSFPYNPLSGVFYVAALVSEADPFRAYRNKLKRLATAFQSYEPEDGGCIVSTGHCGNMSCDNDSVDYIFTDPPFGENIYYSDLNFLTEAWYRVFTNPTDEAIIDRVREKTVFEYQRLMLSAFSEYYRILKPGRWITIVFSNSSNAVWRSIQEALGTSGFVVADVRTLDKLQGSFRQVTSTAVKQDLVISAYKPPESLAERFALGTSSPQNSWAFVTEHLGHVPVFASVEGVADVIAERTEQVLHDRMVAFHVQRQLSVPLSTGEFVAGLSQRYPERDGMYFLPAQVAEYDRKRNTTAELRQLSLFVVDEATAIQWVRRELQDKPRSFQDLQPVFMREIQNWAKHEQTVELKEILRQNCIHYDGTGPVPSQIHSYLSTNFKELRNLGKDDPSLVAKAADRWYVPDPNKQIDLEKLREKSLLIEFETYKASKERKLKLFRSEAVRTGFKAAYDGQDYKTIVSVAAKLPENVLQEDEKLLMYYDVASMRLGDE
jgi:DNA modification methylase